MVKSLDSTSLMAKALEVIPLDELQSRTTKVLRSKQQEIRVTKNAEEDEEVLREMIFLEELIKWFKNEFFQWFEIPHCDDCDVSFKLRGNLGNLGDEHIDVIEVCLNI